MVATSYRRAPKCADPCEQALMARGAPGFQSPSIPTFARQDVLAYRCLSMICPRSKWRDNIACAIENSIDAQKRGSPIAASRPPTRTERSCEPGHLKSWMNLSTSHSVHSN